MVTCKTVFQFVFIFCLPYLSYCQQNKGISFNYNNTYKYNVQYTFNVNRFTEYILEFGGDPTAYNTPARISVASESANRTYPVFITARQQKGVFSWQLPMLVQTPEGQEHFTNVSRTLCPHNIFDEDVDSCDISNENVPIIHLTTSSPTNISVTLEVTTVADFYIKLNTTTNFTTTPSQPKYYFYPFKQDNKMDLDTQAVKRKQFCTRNGVETNMADEGSPESAMFPPLYVKHEVSADSGWFKSWFWRPKSIILMIESDDDLCAVISIQNISCPVFDNERDILYDGYYFTMTRRGGITLTQNHFPLGFYIVFIVKTTDDECVATDPMSNNGTLPKYVKRTDGLNGQYYDDETRSKGFRLAVVETISYVEYLIGSLMALGFFLSFYVAFGVVVIVQRRLRRHVAVVGSEEILSQNEEYTTCPVGESNPVLNDLQTVQSTSNQAYNDNVESAGFQNKDDSDTFSSETDSVTSITEVSQSNPAIKLCLAQLSRAKPKVLSSRSTMYLWNSLTVAVFYTLPVAQLVLTYQRLLNQSGDQDLCYYNFFCAHPLLALSDYNHVFSNIGYVMLGVLFLLQVYRRHAMHKAKSDVEKSLGIPQHFGLLYAMGVALVSEGLLSAAYHVCPNSMNFQFDTSFMYVTGVLCMVKVYQSRHPDINARAHATFGVLALIIFIGLVGVLNANIYFWVAFTVLHLTTCLVMTFQIYYLGRFNLGAWSSSCRARPLSWTPTHAGRLAMLGIGNFANWSLAAMGIAEHSRDFASHLLLILMSNLFLYTLFYIVMKLLHREQIRGYSWILILLTYMTWFSSSYFYLDQTTNWALTPAESRRGNRVCSLRLYDSHDIWHFMSSVAMFFSFNMYLTIDDNLSKVSRTDIFVF